MERLWPNKKTCSRIDVKVHGVNTEILIQAKHIPGLELNLVSTENENSVGRIRIIYYMISSN
jgi:hypothetical protein